MYTYITWRLEVQRGFDVCSRNPLICRRLAAAGPLEAAVPRVLPSALKKIKIWLTQKEKKSDQESPGQQRGKGKRRVTLRGGGVGPELCKDPPKREKRKKKRVKLRVGGG